MIFELRRYQIKTGKMAAWHELMNKTIIPYQVSKGVVVVACFCVPAEPDTFIWIRRFKNEAEQQALSAAMYDSDEWLNVIKPQVAALMIAEEKVVTDLIATDYSPIQ